MENEIFYKFRELEYTDNFPLFKACFNYKGSTNNRFKQILQTSSLFAPDFKQLNDARECGYSFTLETFSLERSAEFRDLKGKKRICSFSRACKSLKEDLLWAHYASGFKGARIDFRVSRDCWEFIRKVEYSDKKLPQFSNYEAAESEILEIMTRKKTCWQYEREYRAIFDENEFDGAKFFPIEIDRIVLGRKNCGKNVIYIPDMEEDAKFDRNIYRIADLFKATFKQCNPDKRIPEIWAYKTMYSPKPMPVKSNLYKE